MCVCHLHRQISFLLCAEIIGGGIDARARLRGQFQRFLLIFINVGVIVAVIRFTVVVFIIISIIINIIIFFIFIIFFVIDWIAADLTGKTLSLWRLKFKFFSFGWTPITDVAAALGPGGDSWRKSVFICSKMLWRRLSSSSFLCS